MRGDSAKEIKVDYENLRTQCAYVLAKAISENRLYLAIESRYDQDFIIEEFTAHQKNGQTVSGKLRITPKDEVKSAINRSPDFFDICLMRMVLR